MIYGLSIKEIDKKLNEKVIIVNIWEDSKSVDELIDEKKKLGDNFEGVVLNEVVNDEIEKIKDKIIN